MLGNCTYRCCPMVAPLSSEALSSRPVPGTPSRKRSAGTHRAVRVVCMPSEGTARAAQLAPSAVSHRQRSRRHRRPECVTRNVSRKKENRFRLGLEHPNVGCCSIELILRQNRKEFQGFFGTSRRHLVVTSSSSPRLNPHHAAMPASHVPPGSDSVVPGQPLQHNHHAM